MRTYGAGCAFDNGCSFVGTVGLDEEELAAITPRRSILEAFARLTPDMFVDLPQQRRDAQADRIRQLRELFGS